VGRADEQQFLDGASNAPSFYFARGLDEVSWRVRFDIV